MEKDINERIETIEQNVNSLQKQVGYLKYEMDREIKHPLVSIFVTVILIGVGVLMIYLKSHPELLNF